MIKKANVKSSTVLYEKPGKPYFYFLGSPRNSRLNENMNVVIIILESALLL